MATNVPDPDTGSANDATTQTTVSRVRRIGVPQAAWVWGLAVLVAAVCAEVARRLFLAYGENSYGRAVAEALIEIAFVVVVGAALNHLLQAAARTRAEAEAKRGKSLEFLQRLRSLGAEVEHARKLMTVQQTAKTYAEQHRALMQITPRLTDLRQELHAERDLFDDQHATTITDDIGRLIEYLNAGESEFRGHYKDVKVVPGPEYSIAAVPDSRNVLAWTWDFIEGGPGFRNSCAVPLADAKTLLRAYAYRPAGTPAVPAVPVRQG
jgi:hypothetical protein